MFCRHYREWCIRGKLNGDERTKLFKEIALRESGDKQKNQWISFVFSFFLFFVFKKNA